MTTKILALTDALGNLVRFVLLPGQRFDTVGVPPLIEGVAFDALIADKAFDSNSIMACTRFRRHRVRCFHGTGGASWRGGSSRESSSLRLCA